MRFLLKWTPSCLSEPLTGFQQRFALTGGVPKSSLRHSLDERHLPSFTQGSFISLRGACRLCFHTPQHRAGSFSGQSPWDTHNGSQQSGRNPKPSSSPGVSCCASWEARLAVLLLPPRALSTCCCCSCAPILWGEAWGKGSNMGEKDGAASLGTCHLWTQHVALGIAQPQSTPGSPCLLQGPWMLLQPRSSHCGSTRD